MAVRGRGSGAAWMLRAPLWGLLTPGWVLAAASAGTSVGASPPGPAADAQAEHQQQRARCQALQVAAVRAECLRQADRDMARRLGPAQPARAAPTAASAASAASAAAQPAARRR